MNINTILDLTGNVGTESIYFVKAIKNIKHIDINELDKDIY